MSQIGPSTSSTCNRLLLKGVESLLDTNTGGNRRFWVREAAHLEKSVRITRVTRRFGPSTTSPKGQKGGVTYPPPPFGHSRKTGCTKLLALGESCWTPKSIFLGFQRRHRAPKMRGKCIEPTPSAQIERPKLALLGAPLSAQTSPTTLQITAQTLWAPNSAAERPKMSDQRAQPTLSMSTQNLTAVLNGTLERPNLPLPKPFGRHHRAPKQFLVVAFYLGVTVPPFDQNFNMSPPMDCGIRALKIDKLLSDS